MPDHGLPQRGKSDVDEAIMHAKVAMWNEAVQPLQRFIEESNRIEGITRPVTPDEIAAHSVLLSMKLIAVADLEAFVTTVAGVPLRRSVGQNVTVGSHRPPPGGPEIERALGKLLNEASAGLLGAYETHHLYEKLHPFLDGNGRSGRALWAWQMLREGRDPFTLPFLHRWYYDSLDAGR